MPVLYLGITLSLGLVALMAYRIGKAYIKGIEGETDVGKILEKLPGAYYSLHDFVNGKMGNIDYVLVGPNGVWTLEVKNTGRGGHITFQNGLLYRNGYPLEGHDLKQSYREAQQLQTFIRESCHLTG